MENHNTNMQHVLIIKLSAIGDFIQSTGAIRDIREAHPDAQITLMTSKMLRTLAESNPNVDEVVYHQKPKWYDVNALLEVRSFLKSFDRIYDLQCNDRTNFYYKLARPKGWCGTAKGSDYYQNPVCRAGRHSGDFLPDQLRMAHIQAMHKPDVSYAAQDAKEALLERGVDLNKLVVLIPGSSAGWMGKRWSHYAQLAELLKQEGYSVTLCGGPDEGELLSRIEKESGAISLLGLSLPQFMDVFKRARFVIGNDTGPMHMAAACGARGIVLFGPASDYRRHAPRSATIEVVHNDDAIDNITPQAVMGIVKQQFSSGK